MRTFGVRWSWFAIWSGLTKKVPAETLRHAYHHKDYITLDERPAPLRPK